MRNELQTILHKIETIMAGEDTMDQLEKDLIKSYLLKAVNLLQEDGASTSAAKTDQVVEKRIEQEKEAMKAALASEVTGSVAQEEVIEPVNTEDIEEVVAFFYRKLLNSDHKPVTVLDTNYDIWTLGAKEHAACQ